MKSENKRKGISGSQMKLLHLAVKQVGMDDGAYRLMLKNVCGVESSKSLTLDGFRSVMEHLKRCGFQKVHAEQEFTGYVARLHKWQQAVGERPGMATPAQLARIETDWNLMRWYWAPEGFGNETLSLRGFLKSVCGVSDLRFLRFGQAHSCIEAIKAIGARRETPSPQPSPLKEGGN